MNLEITVSGYLEDRTLREPLLEYLASEGVDVDVAASVRFRTDGRLEVETYLRDERGHKVYDLARLEIPRAVRTIDPVFCPPPDLLDRLAMSAVAS